MAQYSQFHNIQDLSSETNPRTSIYHSIPGPHGSPGVSYPNEKKHGPAPTAITLGTSKDNQQLKYEYVPTSFPPRTVQYQAWWHRIGYFGLWVLGLGTIMILASCSILVYVWLGAILARDRRHRGELWDLIIFNGYATRVITLCSAAIRVSMAFQTGLLAAAMAAIILETTGTRISAIASLSIARAFIASASPWEIFWIASQQHSKKKVIILLQCLIPLLAFLVNLIATFTSTILLFDFNITPIAVLNTTASIAIGFDAAKDVADFSGTSYWQSRPLAHWRFAETHPTAAGNLTPPKGVADTGDIYRAFIPFANVEDRTSLELLSGPTIVTNLRTICLAPSLGTANLVYKTADTFTAEGLYLEAQVEPSTGWEGGPKVNGNDSLQFSCRINNDWDQTDSEAWPLSMCSFTELDQADVLHDKSLQNPLSGQPYAFQPVILLNASDVLNGMTTTWNETGQNWTSVVIPKWAQPSKIVGDDVWSTALTAKGTELFQASVCFITQNKPLLYNVTMSGKDISAEPRSQPKWRRLHAKTGTEFIKQLGVGISPLDYKARGILDLDIRSGATSFGDDQDDEYANLYDFIEAALFDYSNTGGWTFNNDAFTGSVDSSLVWSAHPEHSLLVQTVLQQTGNPAEALQNLFFRFYQMIFYDMLPYYTAQQRFELAKAKQVLNPTQWTGLIIILSVVAVHLALTLMVIWLFATYTGLSMLGNAWQAVSQSISPDTITVVQAVSNDGMRDKDVQKWTKSTVYNERTYGLSVSVSNGGSRMRER